MSNRSSGEEKEMFVFIRGKLRYGLDLRALTVLYGRRLTLQALINTRKSGMTGKAIT